MKKDKTGPTSISKHTYGNKTHLRKYIRQNKQIKSQLGEIHDLKEVGEGGNGLVFSGRIFDHPSAIKFLVNTKSKEKLIRFKAEYLNVALLPPNAYLVRTLGYEEFDIGGKIYPAIMMKKYNSSLKRNPNVPPSHEELNKLFDFLLKALNFIHVNGVIHRDIKPENILVDNDKFVLTDFGIASYNPEIFKLRAKKHKGERIGNYLFSAPEQIVRGVNAHPSTDIYSLGQICQWYATGSAHRGTKREKLTKYIAGAEAIDIVIDKCLSNRPEDRCQSIQTINADIEALRQKDPWHYVELFGQALAASLPKGLGKATFIRDKKIINRLLTNISLKQFENNLWFTDGFGDMYTQFSKLTEDTWLMRQYEIKIKSIWVYFDLSMYGDLVLLNLEAMPPFGLYKGKRLYEEAGLVDNNHYISRSEYDNGYAEINGEIVNLSTHNVALRCRYLIDKSLVIGTCFHSALQRKNEKEVELFLNKINQGKTISETQFEHFALKLRQNKHPYILETL